MPIAIFDLDGTLTRSTGIDDACFEQALREVAGLRRIDMDWSTYTHATDTGLLREAYRREHGREIAPELFARVRERFCGLLRAAAQVSGACEAIPGAASFVMNLASAPGWKVAIATGAWEPSARAKLAASGLERAFAPLPLAHADLAESREGIVASAVAMLTGGAAGAQPLMASAEHAAAHVRSMVAPGVPLICFGDGVWDLRTARRLGAGFVGIRVDGDERRLRAEGASVIWRDYVSAPRDPAELLALV